MSKTMCPGQDTAFWTKDAIFEVPCGKCKAPVEFFKDDAKRKCPKCGHIVQNPHLNLGCAMWCEHAKECLGYDPKERLAEAGQGGGGDSLVEKLIAAMKTVFGIDHKRIAHAMKVLEYAKTILKTENADPKIVQAAAILHDIGIKEAEKKHGSAAGRFQEMEGPAIAKPIMEELGMDKDSIDHVLKIIANHHSARDIDTPEFRILWDSDWLVNLPEDHAGRDKESINKLIEKVFKTSTGKKMAYELEF